MNTTDLTDQMSAKFRDIEPVVMRKIVMCLFATIIAATLRGEKVKISKFGSFSLRETKSRPGRNPKTGEIVTIDASRKPVFIPFQCYRDVAVQSFPATPAKACVSSATRRLARAEA